MLRGRGAEGRGAGRLGAQRAPRPGALRPLTAPSPPADDDDGEGAGHGGAANRARVLSTTAWSGTNGRLAEGEAAGARRGSWSRPPRSLRRRATVGEGSSESRPGKNRRPVPCPGDPSPFSRLSPWEAAATPGPPSADPPSPPSSFPVPLRADPPPAQFPQSRPSFPPPPCPLRTSLPSPRPSARILPPSLRSLLRRPLSPSLGPLTSSPVSGGFPSPSSSLCSEALPPPPAGGPLCGGLSPKVFPSTLSFSLPTRISPTVFPHAGPSSSAEAPSAP